MQVVTAFEAFDVMPRPWVYLGGGRAVDDDWQDQVCAVLQRHTDVPGTALNPRRASTATGEPAETARQIAWERDAVWRADIVTFWFAAQTPPATMIDLGQQLARRTYDAWIRRHIRQGSAPVGLTYLRSMVIGFDPTYPHQVDVRVQAAMASQAAMELHLGQQLAATFWSTDIWLHAKWILAAVDMLGD